MTKRTRKVLLAATAIVAVVGLGTVGTKTIAHAQGWGDGPGMMMGQGGGMGGGCGGGWGRHGGSRGMMGGGMMGGGMGGGNMLAVMDADEDGAVTRAEFDAFHTLAFTAMDGDGDGKVERQAFIDSRQPFAGMGQGQGAGMGPGQGQGMGMGQQGMGRFSEARAQMHADRLGARFDMWDANKDGTVVASEFESVAGSHFTAMDLNGDGTVSKQESFAKRMFGPRGPMGR